MALLAALQQYISVMVQNLCKKGRLCVNPPRSYGPKGRGQLQIGYPVCDPPKGRGRIVVLFRQCGDSQIPGIPHSHLGRHRLHHTADRQNIHGVHHSLPDIAVPIESSVPVAKAFCP